ncbi:MAG: SCP2 sterol-binding domain-containing protein [Anaerolineae bacterium]|nr:SCP2 sterol-binding domain-containing protein [Anaerolineae bacterium]
METFTYLSQEWAAEATRRLQETLTPEKMKYLTSSMLNIYTHCPDGKEKAVFYSIRDGVVERVSICDADPPGAEFTVTSDYQTFAQISQAKLKARSALMSGKMHLKGNLITALRLAPVVDRLNQVLSTIPTVY